MHKTRIHYYLIEEAKNLLLSSNKSVGELAFFGFEHHNIFPAYSNLKPE